MTPLGWGIRSVAQQLRKGQMPSLATQAGRTPHRYGEGKRRGCAETPHFGGLRFCPTRHQQPEQWQELQLGGGSSPRWAQQEEEVGLAPVCQTGISVQSPSPPTPPSALRTSCWPNKRRLSCCPPSCPQETQTRLLG